MLEQKQAYQFRPGNPAQMGATINKKGINFSIEIEGNQEASLLLYKKGQEEPWEISIDDSMRTGEVGSIFVENIDEKKCEYAYKIDGEIKRDPYGCLIRENRCGLAKIERIAKKKNAFIPFEDLILYKLHVRGFTMQSKGRSRKKGTFTAIEEQIGYFTELGINGIEFMPMYQWEDELKPEGYNSSMYAAYPEESTRKNFWGYGPENFYFAPKTSYAASKNPVEECHHMIDALHEAGIECIMEFYFPQGTKPTLAVDALVFWMLFYGVDGFHLIGQGVPVESIVRHPLLKRTKLFFERVDEEWIYGRKDPVCKNIAEYNNDFQYGGRRFLKGDDGQISDFVYSSRKNPKRHGVVNYMANVNGFTLFDAVSYECKHNEENGEDNQDGTDENFSWNCGIEGYTRKAAICALRKKQIKNAILYVMLAQGTPLIYQGDESGNTQKGNNNAYAMDNSVGWMDYNNTKLSRELREFTKKVIAFRKSHPVLHTNKEMRLMDYQSLGYPDLSYHDERAWYSEFEKSSRYVGCMYCGKYVSTDKTRQDDFIYVAYNAYWESHKFALPTLPEGMSWQVAIHTDPEHSVGLTEGTESTEQKTIEVAPRSVVVLLSKETEHKEMKVKSASKSVKKDKAEKTETINKTARIKLIDNA